MAKTAGKAGAPGPLCLNKILRPGQAIAKAGKKLTAECVRDGITAKV